MRLSAIWEILDSFPIKSQREGVFVLCIVFQWWLINFTWKFTINFKTWCYKPALFKVWYFFSPPACLILFFKSPVSNSVSHGYWVHYTMHGLLHDALLCAEKVLVMPHLQQKKKKKQSTVRKSAKKSKFYSFFPGILGVLKMIVIRGRDMKM